MGMKTGGRLVDGRRSFKPFKPFQLFQRFYLVRTVVLDKEVIYR
jgi:hypothetical protein